MPDATTTAAATAAESTASPTARAPQVPEAAAEKPEAVSFEAFAEGLARADVALLRLHMPKPKDLPTTVEGWTAALDRARKERI